MPVRPDGRTCTYSADSGLATLTVELSDYITRKGWEPYNKSIVRKL
jgi:hypothetical protein